MDMSIIFTRQVTGQATPVGVGIKSIHNMFWLVTNLIFDPMTVFESAVIFMLFCKNQNHKFFPFF